MKLKKSQLARITSQNCTTEEQIIHSFLIYFEKVDGWPERVTLNLIRSAPAIRKNTFQDLDKTLVNEMRKRRNTDSQTSSHF
jgi:hypothetical protein